MELESIREANGKKAEVYLVNEVTNTFSKPGFYVLTFDSLDTDLGDFSQAFLDSDSAEQFAAKHVGVKYNA